MADKVVLDKLDIDEPELLSADEEEPAPEVQEEARPKWYKEKWFIIGTLGAAFLLLIGGVLFWRMTSEKTTNKTVAIEPAHAPGQLPAEVPGPAMKPGVKLLLVRDFAVPIKEENEERVMLYDVAVEFNVEQEAMDDERIEEIRKLLYITVKNKKAAYLIQPGNRERLKDEMTKALASILEKDTVKDIYFTRYLLL